MNVRHARHKRACYTFSAVCRLSRFDTRNRAAGVDGDDDIAHPTSGQKRVLGEQPHAGSIATSNATASSVNGLTESGAADVGSSSIRNAWSVGKASGG
jgi:hypothetical protein